MKLSLAVTTFNRYDFTMQAINHLIFDNRLDEIVIVDDKSTDSSYEMLIESFINYPKVKLFQNETNLGMARNKVRAVGHCRNDWAILLDSDNILKSNYITALEDCFEQLRANENIIFCPDFAMPEFDYRKFDGKIITASNAKYVVADSMGNCLFNTCNYVVNKPFYLSTHVQNSEAGCADTIWHNYLHLKRGGIFYVVPGMSYEHTKHAGSGFLQDLNYNLKKSEEIRKLVSALE